MLLKTKDNLQKINEIIGNGGTRREAAQILGCTHQWVSLLIKRYLPDLTRYNRIEELPMAQRSDLEKIQREKLRSKKNSAKQHGYEFTLKWEDIEWPKWCPVLGLELDYYTEYRAENSVSFDRRDNTLGYIKDNVYIISWRANRIKNDGTAEEHRMIADFIEYGYAV